MGIVDAEPKGPTASVLQKIEPAIPTCSATSLEAIDDAITELRGESSVLVIDTPGTSADELIGLCLLVDLVLIPLQPSDKDLQQVKPFLKLIKAYQINTGGKPESTIAFTFTRRRNVTARSYRRELSPLGIAIAKTEIRRFDDYRDNHIVMRERHELKNELPEQKGFSERNIKSMLAFCREYPNPSAIVQQPVAQLSDSEKVSQAAAQIVSSTESLLWMIPWGHHLLLMGRVKDLRHRLWYMQQTLADGWSRSVLLAMVQSEAHSRQGQAITNFERLLPSPQSDLVQQTLKDPLYLRFPDARRAVPRKRAGNESLAPA